MNTDDLAVPYMYLEQAASTTVMAASSDKYLFFVHLNAIP
jgi:hypothetical protein